MEQSNNGAIGYYYVDLLCDNFMYLIISIIFSLTYLYLANWYRVNHVIKGWRLKKSGEASVLRMNDKALIELIFKRTGVKVRHIYLVPSEKLFAYGNGIPKRSVLFISTTAFQTFHGDALEWLLLHEMGHILYYHAIGITIVQLFYLALGVYILGMIQFPILLIIAAIVLPIGLAIAAIQTNKEFDSLANKYAMAYMKSPEGMKEGALLLMKQLQNQGIHKD